MQELKIRLDFINEKIAYSHNATIIVVQGQEDEHIGSCKVLWSEEMKDYAILFLNDDVNEDAYFSYLGDNTSGIYSFKGLKFTDEPLENHPIIQLKDILV